MNNGRIDTLKDSNFQMYGLFERGDKNMSDFSREAIIGIHTSSPISDLFFSQKNTDLLQEGIRNMVANRSNGEFIIGYQSEVELQVIMRSIYLTEAKHLPYGIVDQVKELNASVINYCVPRILEEVRMFKYYTNDVSKLPIPLERGQFSSAKGMKVLESKEF